MGEETRGETIETTKAKEAVQKVHRVDIDSKAPEQSMTCI